MQIYSVISTGLQVKPVHTAAIRYQSLWANTLNKGTTISWQPDLSCEVVLENITCIWAN